MILKRSTVLLATLMAIALQLPVQSGVDRITASSFITPMLAGDYTSIAVSVDRIYAARAGAVDWLYCDPSTNQWRPVQIISGDYLSITGAPDGTLYGASAAGGVDWIHWAGEWKTARVTTGSYVSVAVNADPSQSGLFAAGSAGGIDRIYWDGVQWTKTNVARGKFISLASDNRNNGAFFAVRSDGALYWINGPSIWISTQIISGSYVAVAADTNNTGNCYALRSNGCIDRICWNGTNWMAVTALSGNYNAITADLAAAGGLLATAIDTETSIPDAKKGVENTHVKCSGLVTGYFNGFFYLASTDRVGGIRVVQDSHKAVEGCSAIVTGLITSLPSGERCIKATSSSVAVDHKLQPFWMQNRSLSGGDFLSSGIGQAGAINGVGLNNIGTLVKLTGNVTEILDNGTLYITDGSATPVKCIDPWDFVGYSICSSDNIVVTGVISIDRNEDGNFIPTLLLTDWRVFRKYTE